VGVIEPDGAAKASPSGESTPLGTAIAAPVMDAPAAERIDLGPPPGPIEASDTFAVAGRKAMWLHVERMLAREADIRDPDQIDSLRKYRVATRRLRAAMRLFRDAYPMRESKPLRVGLGAIAREVGTVRDLDVRIADLDSWAVRAGEGTPADVAPLRAAWGTERRRAAAALERRLATKRHRRLLESLAAFVTTGTVTEATGGTPVLTVRDRVASSAWLAYERLRSHTAGFERADLETLHDIRIAAKRLRYTLEFLGPVLGPQREWLVARLVGLQDNLGHLNDAVVNAGAIRAFLADQRAVLDPGAGGAIEGYLASREQAVATLRRGAGRTWRPVVDAAFAGRLGRAVILPASSERP
jgi:CHAD domain-containing protein